MLLFCPTLGTASFFKAAFSSYSFFFPFTWAGDKALTAMRGAARGAEGCQAWGSRWSEEALRQWSRDVSECHGGR